MASEAVGGCFVFAVLEDDELVDDELELDWESLLARLVALVLDWGLSLVLVLELVVVLEVEDDDDDEEVEGGGVFEGVACWVYANCCSTFKKRIIISNNEFVIFRIIEFEFSCQK